MAEEKMDNKMAEGEKYFDCTDEQRVSFELGIKLGALFHQFVGTPVSSKNIEKLEGAMESTTESQAFVKKAEVSIKPEARSDISDLGPFDYTTLTGKMIEAEIKVEYEGITAEGKMEFIEEMDYPLMYIENFKKE